MLVIKFIIEIGQFPNPTRNTRITAAPPNKAKRREPMPKNNSTVLLIIPAPNKILIHQSIHQSINRGSILPMTLLTTPIQPDIQPSQEDLQHNLDIILAEESEFPQCPPNLSGPDCSIPYQLCPDHKRQCFNNSRCDKINVKDPITNEYKYRCDCSFAADISKYAGHQCEYSATATCSNDSSSSSSSSSIDSKEGHYHFCTNGGLCEDFVFQAQIHTGCNCPRDFAGAHCQYLKALVDMDLIEGEALYRDVGDNFYAFTPKKRDSQNVTGLVVMLALTVLFGVGLVGMQAVVKRRNNRNGNRFTSIVSTSTAGDDISDNNIDVDARITADGKNVRLQTNENPHAEII
jgi:hypothetical protein